MATAARTARRAEDRLHAVAEELRHLAALRLDGATHGGVVTLHERARGLGVDALVQRRRAHQVREDDRDDLARLGRRRGGLGRQRPAAGVTEARASLALAPAGGTAR
jgi:hypothetical protein